VYAIIIPILNLGLTTKVGIANHENSDQVKDSLGDKIEIFIGVLGILDVDALIERAQASAREEGIYLAITAWSLFADENQTDENILFCDNPISFKKSANRNMSFNKGWPTINGSF